MICILRLLSLFLFANSFFLLPVNAQSTIPNAGFEEWEASTAGPFFEEPAGWFTANQFVPFAWEPQAEKVTESYSGLYALAIENKSQPFSFGEVVLAGWAQLGQVDSIEMTQNGAFIQGRINEGFTDRPISFGGFFKYLPTKLPDTCTIIFRLMDTVGTVSIVGEAIFQYTGLPVADFTDFVAEVEYFNDSIPNILSIYMSSSSNSDPDIMVGSRLIVDELSVRSEGAPPTGVASISGAENNVQLFPNPAQDRVQVAFDLPANAQGVHVSLYDLTGRVVLQQQVLTPAQQLDVSSLNPGTYIYKVASLSEATLHGSGKLIVTN